MLKSFCSARKSFLAVSSVTTNTKRITIAYRKIGRNILVDTGGGDPKSENILLSGHAKTIRNPDERPDKALIKIGIRPEEIDTVILTHLHWDHCYNNHLFPQAEFVVQKKELITAVDPLPKFKTMYETFATGLVPPWARQRTKWRIIDGD